MKRPLQRPSDLRLTIIIRHGGRQPRFSVTWTGEPEEFTRLQLSQAFRIILQALAG